MMSYDKEAPISNFHSESQYMYIQENLTEMVVKFNLELEFTILSVFIHLS